MFKNLRKFSELSKSQKIHIVILLLTLFFFPSKLLLEWSGRNFPLKSELHYSEGVLDYEWFGVTLKSIEEPSKDIVFICHYTAFTTRDSGSCMDRKNIEPYLDKPAKIGWYFQSDFLGFSNDFPQLVTLEVEGEQKRYYEKTLKFTKDANMIFLGITLFINIFWLWIFMKIVYPKDTIYEEK